MEPLPSYGLLRPNVHSMGGDELIFGVEVNSLVKRRIHFRAELANRFAEYRMRIRSEYDFHQDDDPRFPVKEHPPVGRSTFQATMASNTRSSLRPRTASQQWRLDQDRACRKWCRTTSVPTSTTMHQLREGNGSGQS